MAEQPSWKKSMSAWLETDLKAHLDATHNGAHFLVSGQHADNDNSLLTIWVEEFGYEHRILEVDLELDQRCLAIRNGGWGPKQDFEESTLPVDLWKVSLPWVAHEILQFYKGRVTEDTTEYVSLQQGGQDLTASIEPDFTNTSDLDLWGVGILGWITWLEVLFDIADGNSLNAKQLGPTPPAYARWALRFQAHQFWQWIEDFGLDEVDWASFDTHSNWDPDGRGIPPYNPEVLDFEMVKERFRTVGLGEGFRLTGSDYFDTPDFDSVALETEVEDVTPEAAQSVQSRYQSSIPTSYAGKKVSTGLSWLISLLVGTAIAIGAALGF